MAYMLGCDIKQIKLLPYGCRMDICNIDSPWDEFMIVLSGPVFSLICFMGCRFISGAEEFARANMYIALINLLPVLPLDGGRAIEAMLTVMGIKIPYILQTAATLTLAAAIGACGYIIKNATMFVFSLFLFTEGIYAMRRQSTSAVSYMKSIRNTAAGRGIKAQHIALHQDVSIGTAISYGFGRYFVFYILDDNMREIARTDITAMTEFAAKYGTNTQLRDIIPFIDRSK